MGGARQVASIFSPSKYIWTTLSSQANFDTSIAAKNKGSVLLLYRGI